MTADDIHTCHPECQRPACVLVREAVAAEREECAKVCETYNKRQPYNDEDMVVANECAFAIRERGAP
jgi:hypothetical protein